MQERVMISIKRPKNRENVCELLDYMEKMVDEKLSSLNNFVPILLSITTSILAFLFVYEVDISSNSGKVVFAVTGGLMFFFAILIDIQFRKTTYKAVIHKTRKSFNPADFESYCYLSDEDFQKCLAKYAGRKLMGIEKYRVCYIKQKINEYVRKSCTVNTIYSIIVFCAIILAATIFLMIALEGGGKA